MNLQNLTQAAGVRYFSLGRFALAAGLELMRLKPGASVLVPAFICRDLLAAIHSVGATPLFYAINEQLEPAAPQTVWPDAVAVLAVNYFGFPQNLEPFEAYCQRTGAVLIEDNAHGLFSRDANGRFLGSRGNLGIFSLRKTIPMPDGAALVVNHARWAEGLRPQVDFNPAPGDQTLRIKRLLLQLPLAGSLLLRLAICGTRCWRKLRTGHTVPLSDDSIEQTIPGSAHPHTGLLTTLAQVDEQKEAARRRHLYQQVAQQLAPLGIKPLLPTLNEHTVPYGFAFYGPSNQGAQACKAVRSLNLECFAWPELPTAVRDHAPAHYTQVWWVNFLAVHV